VYPNPTAHPMTAYITHLDAEEGMVHINLAHKKGKWKAYPRAIVSMQGEYLHFDGQHFVFQRSPKLQ
jgi:hypothetical protein